MDVLDCHQSSSICRQRSSCKLNGDRSISRRFVEESVFICPGVVQHRTAHARAKAVYPCLFRKRKCFCKFANRLWEVSRISVSSYCSGYYSHARPWLIDNSSPTLNFPLTSTRYLSWCFTIFWKHKTQGKSITFCHCHRTKRQRKI